MSYIGKKVLEIFFSLIIEGAIGKVTQFFMATETFVLMNKNVFFNAAEMLKQ
jgi:hypothetical protein